jgi:hypothetical protein
MFVIPDVEVGDLDSLCLLATAARVAAIDSPSAAISAQPDCAGRSVRPCELGHTTENYRQSRRNEIRFPVAAGTPAFDRA